MEKKKPFSYDLHVCHATVIRIALSDPSNPEPVQLLIAVDQVLLDKCAISFQPGGRDQRHLPKERLTRPIRAFVWPAPSSKIFCLP